MVIGTCGFVGTGSSAVSDYLKEFSSVNALDMFEFLITHGPDGIEDLDFQLNEHCVKYTSSSVAIERFRSNIFNYLIRSIKDKKMASRLIECLDKYVDSITQVKWKGYGAIDNQLFGSVFYENVKSNMIIRRMSKKIYRNVSRLFNRTPNCYPLYDIRFSMKPDEFAEKTKTFITEIFSICGVNSNKTVVLDQPFSAIDPYRSFKYFDDPRAIIVDRDPCDLFLLTKCYFHPLNRAFCVPTDRVEDFIEYYKQMRVAMYENLKKRNDNVLVIRFEDLVYQYETTRRKINQFCELNEEDRIYTFFDPKMSIANTQLIKRYPKEEENVKIIRDKLGDYLFDFEKYGDIDTSGKMFPNRSPLNK